MSLVHQFETTSTPYLVLYTNTQFCQLLFFCHYDEIDCIFSCWKTSHIIGKCSALLANMNYTNLFTYSWKMPNRKIDKFNCCSPLLRPCRLDYVYFHYYMRIVNGCTRYCRNTHTRVIHCDSCYAILVYAVLNMRRTDVFLRTFAVGPLEYEYIRR